MSAPAASPEPLVIRLTRDAFQPWVVLHLPDGSTEELDVDEAMAWLTSHGGDKVVVEKALDHVWNMLGHRRPIFIKISNPKVPLLATPRLEPRL